MSAEDVSAAAAKPKAVKTDGTEVQSRDIGELIEAENFAAGTTAVKQANRGLRFNKLSPPGTA